MLTKEKLLAHLEYNLEISQEYINGAGNNNGHACSKISFAYQFGETNYFKAMAWYQLATNENDDMAYNNIGCMHSAGLGACHDYHIAMEYFLKAAELSNRNSMSNIGDLFFYGKGVTVNLYYALAWYIKSGKRPERVLKLYKKRIFLREVDQKKPIYQMINETSAILRKERAKKERENIEALRGQIRKLESQSQQDKEENTLYKQKFELIERLLQSQQEEITVLNRNFARWELHHEVNCKLRSLEESIALIVSDSNTNGNKCRHNGAYIDTMKNVKIKEEPLPCEMSAKQRKILYRGI